MVKINIEPMGKPRMTQRDRWAKRPVVERYYGYCDTLREVLPGYNLPGELIIEFHIPMAKSWPNKRKLEMAGKPHQLKPDIDNLVKAYMDAFKADDSHVWRVTATKYWANEGCIIVQ